MHIRDYHQSDALFCLFKGEPSVGKTRALASFPKLYLISTDGSIGVIKRYFSDSDIEFDVYTSFWDVYLKLEELQEKCPYRTVAIDSLTNLALFAIEHSIQFRQEDRTRNPKTKGDPLGHRRGDFLLPEVEDYGSELRGLYQTTLKLKDIWNKHHVNVILTAHVLSVTDAMTKKESRTLLTAGKKIAGMIPVEFSEIYHFGVEGPLLIGEGTRRYIVSTQHDGNDFARTSLPLPERFDITDRNFYEVLMGYINPTTKENQ